VHPDPAVIPGDRRATSRAVIRVVVAGTCWGLAAVMAKVAFDRGVPPIRMAEARVVVALAVLVVILVIVRRELLRPPTGVWPPVVAFGVCVVGVNAAYYVAIDRLPVGVAVSLQYTAPVLMLGLTAMVAVVRHGRPPGRLAWVAAGLTLGGAVLVSQAYLGLDDVDARGLVAAAASALLFAGYLLTASWAGRRGIHPAGLLFWGFLVALAVWTPVAPWWSWPASTLSQPQVVLAVLGVGLVGTLLPFFLSVGAVRVLSPATAGIAATVEPPAAALFAWVFLGQHLTAVQLLGGAMVVAGVVLAYRVPMGAGEALGPEAVAVESAV
jgi:drug/metabolite transporter (DMT)-like permease